MAANKISNHEKRDLEKFTKYLVYKCIQIIVQARLGEKKKSQSKPFSTGMDWFSMAIPDQPAIAAETKKVCGSSNRLLFENTVNVETSLQTSEGENMILEVWSMSINPELMDNARIHYTVYNRMSVLLKSLMCVSRVTPAYKLSRRQGSETYVICYRVYLGTPETSYLGSGSSQRRVGAVPTPCGTIEMNVHYRTKIMFSPHQSALSIELKDDHFTEVNSGKNIIPRPCNAQRRASIATPEADYEPCATVFSTSPVSPYRSPGKQRRRSLNGEMNGHGAYQPNGNEATSPLRNLKVAGFAGRPITEQPKLEDDDIPFSKLLHPTDNNANKRVNHDQKPGAGGGELKGGRKEDAVDNADDKQMRQWRRRRHASADSGSSSSQPDSDFVMVELKTPFAGQDGASELGRFYRECQAAPPLHQHCGEDIMDPDPKHFMNNITDQLSQFELQSYDFDHFIENLVGNEDE